MNKPKKAKRIKKQRQNRTHNQRLQRKEELLQALTRSDFQINDGNRQEILGSISTLETILRDSKIRLDRSGCHRLAEADRFLLQNVYSFFVDLEKLYLKKVEER